MFARTCSERWGLIGYQAHKPLSTEEIQIFKELFDSYVSVDAPGERDAG
jgi:hypothetical protein